MSLAEQIASWIREQIDGAGLNGAIVGLSGGIDSATVAGLAARGLGSDRVLGVIMPAHSHADDIEHAKLVAETFNLETLTIDLAQPFDLLMSILPSGTQLATANLKPRLRMLTLYHVANTRGLMVVGTGNRTELMVGYFTKYGDGGVDLLPLGSALQTGRSSGGGGNRRSRRNHRASSERRPLGGADRRRRTRYDLRRARRHPGCARSRGRQRIPRRARGESAAVDRGLRSQATSGADL